jgi:hypothetical protein
VVVGDLSGISQKMFRLSIQLTQEYISEAFVKLKVNFRASRFSQRQCHFQVHKIRQFFLQFAGFFY